MSTSDKHGISTRAVHAGVHPDQWQGAVSPPIYQTSTFGFASTEQGANRFAGKEDGYIYTRLGNPTIGALEEAVAALEGGTAAFGTASGMAAVTAVYFAFLEPGAKAVCSSAVYGPSRVMLETEFSRFGVESEFLDTGDLDALRAAVTENTKLVFVETPTNPTLKVTDLEKAAEIAHSVGALLVVDNTFMSPVLQQPFRHGADIVLHSMTKFLNGHGDVVAGMLVTKDDEIRRRLTYVARNLGGTMDPHQAWLVHRGIKTLPMRVERAQENAIKVADWLRGQEKVEWVDFPGFEDHPAQALIGTQMKGPGSLMTFGVKGGIEAGRKLLDNVELMVLAVSLGGVETLIQHPASMTHAGISPEGRAAAGITDGLIRLSVGCENWEDIRDDLDHALSGI
ncbi:MAG: aminotransferase class I/II-fold pyridoxal phosphate-dependent enzyme [Planctomycetota bacterium]